MTNQSETSTPVETASSSPSTKPVEGELPARLLACQELIEAEAGPEGAKELGKILDHLDQILAEAKYDG
ncbi:hypothetical protein BSR29_03955 [Boudabousia liubingyangii]|uniref:Uncharacterized protein n=1 Tax=Boudabousia liubingyangii TaxID=1921764 RepID=A0A1Q5PN88_9ACTO|nr:hypothetical protein [Boudabousia liubingyangii]OKL47573.1 hypothetical protein BSR28_03525 [Boudabousia liubingyangii]OKL48997.1 hypothetical protein BSR29_03955 [Boudabousia liubingyangii]